LGRSNGRWFAAGIVAGILCRRFEVCHEFKQDLLLEQGLASAILNYYLPGESGFRVRLAVSRRADLGEELCI
jgi:hypothetical protein